MSEHKFVDPKNLRPGPIRNESLPPKMLDQIEVTLEQFEIGFMRDMHPDGEVALWCSITAGSMQTN